MNHTLFFFAPDAGGAAPTPVPKPRVNGPFNKATMARLDEAEEVAQSAQLSPYAEILGTKYGISAAQIAALLSKIDAAERLFGSARTKDLSSQTSTIDKGDAEDAIIEAIDEFRTGARLSLKTEAEMRAFGIGVDLEKNASVLAQLAQTILDDGRSATLRGIGPDEIAALQSALADWKASGGDQRGDQAASEGDHSQAQALFEEIKAGVREIKIAIDGKFSYKKPDSREARHLFHLPPKRAYAPRMGE